MSALLLDRTQAARFVTDGDKCFLIVAVTDETAQRGVNAMGRGEFTDLQLALAVSDAVNLKCMPGLIASTLTPSASPDSAPSLSSEQPANQDLDTTGAVVRDGDKT